LPESIQSLRRGLQVIELLSQEREDLGLAEIARRLKMVLTTAGRVVSTLQAEGFVTRTSSGKFALSAKFVLMGARRVDLLNIMGFAGPVLDELRDATGETAFLAVRVGDYRCVVEGAESGELIRASVRLGAVYPICGGATGYALLADAETDEIQALYFRQVDSFEPHVRSHISLDAVEKAARRAGRDGYVIEHTDSVSPGICCVAFPIRAYDGCVVAAIGIGGPDSRWNLDTTRPLIPWMLGMARQLSAALGFVMDGTARASRPADPPRRESSGATAALI
jgi:DNA-binding IclR family transcriptional regulator